MIPLGPVTSTNGTTYSAAQVQALLQGPSLQMRWFFDLLSAQLAYRLDLTSSVYEASRILSSGGVSVSAPTITYDAGRAVKRQLTFTMRSLSSVNVRQDLVRARYEVLAPDGGWLDWGIG